MKRKKLTGRLSLEKSRISALDSAKITGGSSSSSGGPTPDTQVFCIITRDNNNCVTRDVACTVTATVGSACKCL